MKPGALGVCLMLLIVASVGGMGAELNEACRTTRDCRSFGYVCRGNRTCQCSLWYIPNADNTKCVGGVDQKCLYDEHCVEGAYCQNQSVCKCKETSPFSYDNGMVCASSMQWKSSYTAIRYSTIFLLLYHVY